MIPDFTDAEIATVHKLLIEHYQKDVEIQLADSEILISAKSKEPTICPTLLWFEREANFVVVKKASSAYRAQFFYTPHEQYDTEIDEYNDLQQCVAAVLQAQSDNQRT